MAAVERADLRVVSNATAAFALDSDTTTLEIVRLVNLDRPAEAPWLLAHSCPSSLLGLSWLHCVDVKGPPALASPQIAERICRVVRLQACAY